MLSELKAEVAKHLTWLKRHPDLPTNPNDRAVRRLMYAADGEVEMGMVCEKANGTYWAFSTCRDIQCTPPEFYFVEHKTIQQAAAALHEYVIGELTRVICLHSDMPLTTRQRVFKKRDRRAFDRYGKGEKSSAEAAFRCGVDWALRSEGFPRRPLWAKFLVQNRDGSFTWFEHMPTIDHNNGLWVATDGRSLDVKLSDAFWATGIVRLA